METTKQIVTWVVAVINSVSWNHVVQSRARDILTWILNRTREKDNLNGSWSQQTDTRSACCHREGFGTSIFSWCYWKTSLICNIVGVICRIYCNQKLWKNIISEQTTNQGSWCHSCHSDYSCTGLASWRFPWSEVGFCLIRKKIGI